MATQFDALVIGTGQAGPPTAERLSNAGMRVAVIERHLFGGTCVNTGCIPTKAMVASAYVAHTARRASVYGVNRGADVTVDMKAVKARTDEISGYSRSGVESWVRGMKNVTVCRGAARFEDSHTVSVNGEQLQAPKIFINVGGRAFRPPLPGLDGVPYLTNSTLLQSDTLPRHLIVVGGGYVGLEFGQMFRRFGSEVTLIEMGPQLIGREDADVSQAMREILEGEGVHIRLEAKCISVARGSGDDSVTVNVDCRDGEPAIGGSHLLLAVGRVPNTHDLGLDRAGVETDAKGYIKVDDFLRTNVPGIWALGDCNGRGAFTHTAYNDFEIVTANLLDNDPRKLSDRIPCYGLFTDPPLGRVGMTDAQIRESGRRVLVANRPMSRVGRARERGEMLGFMKVAVDADTHEILGATILGVNGDEAVHTLLDVMYAKAPYTTLRRAMHIHPTISELIPTLLGSLKEAAGSN